MTPLIGFMDTRTNKEDLALTPYLGLVYVESKIYGLSITWIYFSIYFALAFNVPKNFPKIRIKKYKP